MEALVFERQEWDKTEREKERERGEDVRTIEDTVSITAS